MNRSLAINSTQQNVILLGAGAEESTERSEISTTVPALVAASVRGIRSRLDTPYISPEIHLQATIKREAGDPRTPQVLVRGVATPAWLVHAETRLIAGRLPAPGKDELILGRLVEDRLGFAAPLGSTLWLYDRPWTVVGTFEAPNSILESEIWCPLTDLAIASRRDSLSCVVVTLEEAEFDDLDTFAKRRLDLELVAMRESDYHKKLADLFALIRIVVWLTAILIASGGLLGGLNTMYAAFASRVREIGALQALGFSRRVIVLSFLQESLLTALSGTLLALALGLLFFDGFTVQFSLGVFGLMLDAPVVLTGISAGVLVGILGVVPPAWRCLRLPITEALKG
jgi:putative ABC transport system permease protein